MPSIKVVKGDITKRRCDLMILKHADDFYGVDEAVASIVGFSGSIDDGDNHIVAGKDTGARKILFLGLGPLADFRYEKIRAFGAEALGITASVSRRATVICSPVHGPGYGLDEKESVLSLICGFFDALDARDFPPDLESIEIVEMNGNRADRYAQWLDEYQRSRRVSQLPAAHGSMAPASFGRQSEEKPKLFVAMPFAREYNDIYTVAISDAAHEANIIAERLLEQAYVGDILFQIKERIRSSQGFIAVLDGANPNVFLELGYAWALDKPSILIAKEGTALPFDVKGHRCVIYEDIGTLRDALKGYLRNLCDHGVFADRG